MSPRPDLPCGCGSGLPSQRCCAGKPAVPGPDPHRAWVERHVIGEGDLLLYGRLEYELEELDPEGFWEALREAAEPYVEGGPGRTQALHTRIDRTLEALVARDQRFGYPPPFCHKGCANCCHEMVYCTPEEAEGILTFCLEQGLVIDHAKLARQLAYVAFDAAGNHTGATTWNDQPLEDQSCVFLSPTERACTIWPVRPAVCRVHLAEGTDAFCRPHNGVENPEARGIDYIELDYLLSAVFTVHRRTIRRTMGRLLLDLANG